MKHAAFVVEPLTLALVDEAAAVFALSMQDALRPLFPLGATPHVVEWRKARLRSVIARACAEMPSRLFPRVQDARGTMRGKLRAVVARERRGTAGRVAGLYLFELIEEGRATEVDEALLLGPEDDVPFPPGARQAVVETFFAWKDDAKRKHMGNQTYAYHNVAAVHPDFQGSGVHAALASYFSLTAVHDWAHVPAYLEAFTTAHAVWTHLGYAHLQSYDISALSLVRADVVVGGDDFGLAGAGAETNARRARAERGEHGPEQQEEEEEEEEGGDGADESTYSMHTMLRSPEGSLAVLERYGGVRGALAALIPRTEQDHAFA